MAQPAEHIDADDLAEVNRRLERWASFAGGWYGPRGAPRVAIEYQAVFGRAGAEPDWPADVQQTEDALTALGIENKRSLDVVRWIYVQHRTKYEIGRKLRIRADDLDVLVAGIMRRVNDLLVEIDAEN